jgi:hypothetical protein
MIGTLGGVAACAGILGIDSPSEPGAMVDAGDEAVPDGAAGDALPSEDAPTASSGGDAEDGGPEDDSSGALASGVPCGNTVCPNGFACCYTAPREPIRCMTTIDCTAQGGDPVECDGPEDCAQGQECCGGLQLSGRFLMVCTQAKDCSQAVACPLARAHLRLPTGGERVPAGVDLRRALLVNSARGCRGERDDRARALEMGHRPRGLLADPPEM